MVERRTAARFPGAAPGAPLYESFYLKACHPRGRQAVWVRYTIRKRPGAAPTGSLWCTLFDADAPAPLAAKVTLAPGELRADPDDYIRVGHSRFAPGLVTGDTSNGSGQASWNLRFEPGGPALDHLPRRWMYRAPLPRTKLRTPYPAARFSGTVTVGDRVAEMDGWPGMVGHNWGVEHAERWVWLHAAFPAGAGGDQGDGSDGSAGSGKGPAEAGAARGAPAWLDVAAARVALGPLVAPWVAYGALALGGRRHQLGGIGKARATRIQASPGACSATFPGAGLVVHATVAAPSARTVAWEYADPTGSIHHVLNCSIADLDVVVERPGAGPLKLRAPESAAYELGLREQDHGIPLQPFPDGG